MAPKPQTEWRTGTSIGDSRDHDTGSRKASMELLASFCRIGLNSSCCCVGDTGDLKKLGHTAQNQSSCRPSLKNPSGDATQEYLADGMTEALIGRLSGIHDLRVISRTS